MNDISIYLSPRIINQTFKSESIGEHLISHTETFFPDLEANSIALISCPEYRNDLEASKLKHEHSEYFETLADLHYGDAWSFKIYDLGVIVPGNEVQDSYFALKQIVSELLKKNILPIVIGGSQDLTFAMYEAYQKLEQLVNLTTIDSKFDLGDPEEELKSSAFISKILMHRP